MYTEGILYLTIMRNFYILSTSRHCSGVSNGGHCGAVPGNLGCDNGLRQRKAAMAIWRLYAFLPGPANLLLDDESVLETLDARFQTSCCGKLLIPALFYLCRRCSR
jgi:hypothetical protein